MEMIDPEVRSGQPASGSQIDVVEMRYVGANRTSWQELFAGFNRLYAITYSSGMVSYTSFWICSITRRLFSGLKTS
jgi:hypothetical protein